MAQQLNDFDFNANRKRGAYPWQDWGNGSVWKIKEGEDFKVPLKSMRTVIAGEARRQNRYLKIAILEEEKAIVFQLGEEKPENETDKEEE